MSLWRTKPAGRRFGCQHYVICRCRRPWILRQRVRPIPRNHLNAHRPGSVRELVSSAVPLARRRSEVAVAHRYQAREATSTAFSPPKAKEFDIATLTCACRATFGTISRSHSGSTSSKLAVGGIVCL